MTMPLLCNAMRYSSNHNCFLKYSCINLWQKTFSQNMDENDLFFRQHKGGKVVMNRDYQYHKMRDFKNGSSVWRCSAYKKCKRPGTITIKGDQSLKASQKLHTCEPLVGRNLVTREIEDLKNLVTKSDKPITQLYDEAYNSFQNKGLNFVSFLPPFSSVQHSLYDKRNKALGVMKTVYKNLEEVQIPPEFYRFHFS